MFWLILVTGLTTANLVPSICFAQGADVSASADRSGDIRPTTAPESVNQDRAFRKYGIGAKVSTLGAGIEVATPLTRKTNLRVGFNDFSYSGFNFDKDGIKYGGQLELRSFTANLDWFLLGPLHFSPGVLLYNANKVTATATVPNGQFFTLGSTSYVSNSVNGNASVKLGGFAPEFLIGLGNMVPRGNHHFNVHFELGAIYQGVPTVKLNLAGQACTPSFNTGTGTFAATNCQDVATYSPIVNSVQSEQNKLANNDTLRLFKFYPVVSLGFSYKF